MSKREILIPGLLTVLMLIGSMSSQVLAQIVGSETLSFKNFTFHSKPPSYLASRKSVVFLSVPPSDKNPTIRSDWKSLSEKIHRQFKQMKIDAVGYYYLDEVFNNVDPSGAFAREMVDREIKYVILVEQKRDGFGTEAVDSFKITVAPFNNESTFIDDNANAWKLENNDLDKLLKDMFNTIYLANLEVANYLIPDIPEFFTSTDMIYGRRMETYAMDLKVEKLIVPKFQKYLSKDSTKLDEDTRERIRKYNQEIDRKNERLQQIMNTYPLKYELSDVYTDKEVFNKGGQFLLLRLDATGQSIREFLEFKIDPGETIYATIKSTEVGPTVRRLPSESVVSKFYVKHVDSKDVYTGLKWDADLTWEEALENFIFNMKDILKIK